MHPLGQGGQACPQRGAPPCCDGSPSPMQFARTVLGLADANSAEFEPACATPVVVFMPEGSTTHKGGTMRLGTRRTILQTMDCITAKLYQAGRPHASACARFWQSLHACRMRAATSSPYHAVHHAEWFQGFMMPPVLPCWSPMGALWFESCLRFSCGGQYAATHSHC